MMSGLAESPEEVNVLRSDWDISSYIDHRSLSLLTKSKED